MRKQLAILDYSVGALRRRAGKSGALVFGLAFVVWLFSSALLLTDALKAEYERTVETMPSLTVQKLVAGRPALIGASIAESIASLPTVRSVRPRVWGYYFFTAIEANVTVIGIAQNELGERLIGLEGELPNGDDEVALGTGIAHLLGLRVGDEMGIPTSAGVQLCRVVGLFEETTAARSADLVVATEEGARALLAVPDGEFTDIAVELTTQDESSVVAQRIDELLPGARILDKRLLARTYELTFDARGGLLAALILPAIAAFLLLAWERLSGLGATERREIGVLKAVGWQTADVLSGRIWESLILSFVGTAMGLLMAYVYVFFLDAPGLKGALLGWSAIQPAMNLTPAFDASQAAAILAAVVIPFVSVSVVPAWRAAMIDPGDAMGER